MSRTARLPAWGSVFRAQLRRTLGARRISGWFLLAVVVAQIIALGSTGMIFGLQVTYSGTGDSVVTTVDTPTLRQFEDMGFGTTLDEGLAAVWFAGVASLLWAALWPIRVWKSEAPPQRDYHWSMPIRRSHHDLTRVLAGGVWVGLIATILVVIAVATAAVSGHTSLFSRLTPWFWINLVMAPLLVYALASIPYVRAMAKPGIWFWGGLLAMAAVVNLAAVWSPNLVWSVLRPVLGGSSGALSTLIGPLVGEVTATSTTHGPHLILGWLLWATVFGTGLWIASSTRPRRL